MEWLTKLIAFFFLPTGLTGRGPFAVGLIGYLVLAAICVWLNVSYDQDLIINGQRLEPLLEVLIVVKCVATSRRLHDVGLTGWLCLPALMVAPLPAFYRLFPNLFETAYRLIPFVADKRYWGLYLYLGGLGISLLGDLILCFIPSRKTPASSNIF